MAEHRNAGKGAGVRFDYAATPSATLTYYNVVSAEAGTRLRTFNGVRARINATTWTLRAEADVGTQSRGADAGTSRWVNTALIARRQLTPRVRFLARGEYAADPDQVVLSIGSRVDGPLEIANVAFRAAATRCTTEQPSFTRCSPRACFSHPFGIPTS